MRGIVGGLVVAALLGAGGAAPLAGQVGLPPERVAAPRGWLGLSLRSPAEGREAAPSPERGVVEDVYPGSPAATAGVQAGDTIVRWNGRTDVGRAVRETRLHPGDTVRVRVRRGGERDRDLALVAGPLPERVARVRAYGPGGEVLIPEPGEVGARLRLFGDSLALRADSLHERLRIMMRDSLGPRLREMEPELRRQMARVDSVTRSFDFALATRAVAGAELTELNPGLASYFGTDRGVLVLRVAPGTPAARAGLEAGDVVVRAGGQAVSTVRELRRAVAGERPGEVELQVVRRQKPRTLRLPGPRR